MSQLLPLGASLTDTGAHFSVCSLNATLIELCLFTGAQELRIAMAKSGADRHSVFAPGIKSGQQYGFRAQGPWDEPAGHRFDQSKLLLDPYAKAITAHCDWHDALSLRGTDTATLMPKCILRAALPNLAPLTPQRPKYIYEVPVKALTKLHPDVPANLRGTVAALAHPSVIAHFKLIGCDAVQLMPIAAWTDERHLVRQHLRNAWGYNPVALMAPEPELAPGGLMELRDTVQLLHENGLRVYLDVVFNHTGESDYGGATISLRGLDNALYFRINNGVLVNDTGCGNTLALDRPATIELVITTLRHWALQCGIDGFRYDLATIMGREDSGFNPHAPLLEAINNDDVLGKLVHIAEPWDVGIGGYQLGNFPQNWLEWNDHFRDDLRRYWRGDAGAHRSFATRLAGSSDIFGRGGRKPSCSVNFVAAHDGFALGDVVRFSQKQNLANGENNRDGSSSEICWVDANPADKVKGMLASLFLSRGTIMITAGDEFGRSQNGNNNAYAQDNETTWRNWNNHDQSLLNFVAEHSRVKLTYGDFFDDEFLAGTANGGHDVIWFGLDGQELTAQDWNADHLKSLGLMLQSPSKQARLAIVFSSQAHASKVTLPTAAPRMVWQKADQIGPSDLFSIFLEKSATS